MKLAETVTFGGSALDRGAEHRRDPARIATLWHSGKVLLMWRGRPLLQDGMALAWLPATHDLAGQVGTALFLGMDGDQATFAQDISAWMPVEPVAQQAGFFDTSVQAH
ncbi:MAG: NADH pyrophosphatase, partial [Candidatus Saccharibacteria bacterium]|nr:NADH pyrophosphatase [Pseudorhodobacter sp.]